MNEREGERNEKYWDIYREEEKERERGRERKMVSGWERWKETGIEIEREIA